VQIVLIASTVSFLLTVFFALKITDRIAQPVERLGATVERISSGERTLAAEIVQEDEIGVLARSFNRMSAQLIGMSARLERVSADRAASLERCSSQIQAAAEVGREASWLYDYNQLLDKAAQRVQERFKCFFVGIYLREENQENAVLKAVAGEEWQDLVGSHRIKMDVIGTSTIVNRSGQAKFLTNPGQERLQNQNLVPQNLSQAILPLKIGEKITGALEVMGSSVPGFDEDSLAALEAIACHLALALENASILKHRDNVIKEIETAYGNYTLNSWQEYMKRSSQIRGYRFHGNVPEPASELAAESLEAWQSEQVVQKTAAAGEQQDGGDISKTIAIPIRIRGQTIGVTNIRLKGGDTSPETTALFEEVVNRLALTLENVRLLEESNLRSEQLHLLQEITSAAAAHINLVELLEAVGKRILAGYHLSRCGVLLLDKTLTEAVLVVDGQADPQAVDMTSARVQLVDNEALKEFIYLQRSGISEEVQSSPSMHLMHEFFAARGTHMLLVVPLISRGETTGLILMESDDPERRFREDDLRLADQIGLQVSTAIDVAILFEQTERRAEKEKVISEATTHIRETLDIETVLKTAAREMRRALNLAEVEIRLSTGDIGDSQSAREVKE
jgi:GAF domain-containing protein/HAMP domain-containing protein